MEEEIRPVLICAEICNLFDFARLKAENQTPCEVETAADSVPPPMMIYDVVTLFSDNYRLRLKTGFAQLIEESQNLFEAMLVTSKRVMTRKCAVHSR